MSNDTFKNHLQRLKAGASQAVAVSEISRWISDNTFINGKPYSYDKHEYQKEILDCTAREINVQKCSQIGLSEISVRKALALCGMIKNFTVIMTLPTASFAATLSKTRVDPVIKESPYLREMLTDTDNVEVKQLGTSFLYIRGCASNNAPISIPASCLIHDEIDFSDSHTVSQYKSRLTHSEHKMIHRLSTPTIPGKGINLEFMRSKRYFNFVKCSCCNHFFLPYYYDHLKIPGYTGELLDITKKNIHTLDHANAYIECPKCGGKPNLGPEHREWVCENPTENHLAVGYQVTPHDAPRIITPAYLVEASTSYQSVGDFVNFSLGLPYFSSESVLSPDEIRGTIVSSKFEGSQAYVMGIDLGKTCHICVAACSYDGAMQVVHLEAVPLQLLREKYKDLRARYRVRTSTIDSLPYTDTVLALQALDPYNLWASVYTNTKGTDLFTVKQKDEEKEKGLQAMRVINVSRNRTFDALMAFIRSGQFSKVTDEHDDEFVAHCTDMRRVKDWNMRSQEIEFSWIKSESGADHYFFALSYAFLSKHIIGTFSGAGGGTLPLLSSFKVKPELSLVR